MINEEAQKHILSAIEKEKDAAISNYGHFHSDHEFWAVLKEEVEEINDEIAKTNTNWLTSNFWDNIKKNKSLDVKNLQLIRGNAINAACEAVQVVAVIDKYIVNKEREKINVGGKTKES